jgi:hypothetical protein
MTDQEINKAIAESVGWTQIRECEDSFFQGLLVGVAGDGAGMAVPDFANSYNAILPLLRALKKGRENRFVEKLIDTVHPDVCIHDNYIHIAYCHALITATPRQLCEVYLAVGGAYA